MTDPTFVLDAIGGFVLVALLLRLAGAWLDAHDDDPFARHIPAPH
ncbi:hypothetical protein AB0F91_37810 [Amycolatopsis sp. NPDC023774]